MSVRYLLCTSAAFLLVAAPAQAKEVRKEVRVDGERTCVCTMGHPDAPLPPVPPLPPIPPVPPTPGVAPTPPPGAFIWKHGEGDGDVQIFRHGDGDEDRVVIVRKHKRHDSADANRDGKITRREFLRKAEKRFEKLDKNGDGVLSEKEARSSHAPSFAMPLLPAPPAAPLLPVPEGDE